MDPNYRVITGFYCITVCSNLGKIFSGILNNRLLKFVDTHNLLKKEQIGFRKKARSSDHMLLYASQNKQKFYICFVDFAKAFDSVWRDWLLFKLLHYNIKGSFYNILKSMSGNVSCCVKTVDGFTEFFNSTAGVKQGKILSPLLFNLFLNDIPNIFDDTCDPALLGPINLNTLMYADDLL